jgi:hypothetical protein
MFRFLEIPLEQAAIFREPRKSVNKGFTRFTDTSVKGHFVLLDTGILSSDFCRDERRDLV